MDNTQAASINIDAIVAGSVATVSDALKAYSTLTGDAMTLVGMIKGCEAQIADVLSAPGNADAKANIVRPLAFLHRVLASSYFGTHPDNMADVAAAVKVDGEKAV